MINPLSALRTLIVGSVLAISAIYGEPTAPSLHERANALVAHGNGLVGKGQLDGAQADFTAATVIYQKMYDDDPYNALLATDLYNLTINCQQLGDTYRGSGKFEQARKAYKEALGLIQQLVDKNPKNNAWRLVLSIENEDIGLVEQKETHLAAALVDFSKALKIQKGLVQEDPTNTGYSEVLGISYLNMGAIEKSHQAAFTDYQTALAIYSKLVQTDPKNATWLQRFIICHLEIGEAERDMGNKDDAKVYLEKGIELVKEYIALKPDDGIGASEETTFLSDLKAMEPTPTPTPSPTPSPTPTPTASPTPTPWPTTAPTATAPQPSPSRWTPTPTTSPIPTNPPTPAPTAEPTSPATPTAKPMHTPRPVPTAKPTRVPTPMPPGVD